MKTKKLLALAACLGIIIAPLFIGSLAITGCTTTQQQTTYNTLYTVEHATVTAYDGYVGLVVGGTLPTNGVPRVSKAFNTFQASFLVALDAAQYNTNALAPSSLVVESQDVINLIANIKKDSK
jgi:hypothetical protein